MFQDVRIAESLNDVNVYQLTVLFSIKVENLKYVLQNVAFVFESVCELY